MIAVESFFLSLAMYFFFNDRENEGYVKCDGIYFKLNNGPKIEATKTNKNRHVPIQRSIST